MVRSRDSGLAALSPLTPTETRDGGIPALALPAALLLAARDSGTPALSARVAAAVSAAGNHGERVVRAAARHRHVARPGAGRNALSRHLAAVYSPAAAVGRRSGAAS